MGKIGNDLTNQYYRVVCVCVCVCLCVWVEVTIDACTMVLDVPLEYLLLSLNNIYHKVASSDHSSTSMFVVY